MADWIGIAVVGWVGYVGRLRRLLLRTFRDMDVVFLRER